MVNKDFFEKLRIEFVNDNDWKKLQELMMVKLLDCKTKEEFRSFLEKLLASMFRDIDELDETRKELGHKVLSEQKKKNLNKKLKDNETKKKN